MLTSCEECKERISTRADACPHCGCPRRSRPSIARRETHSRPRTRSRFDREQPRSSSALPLVVVLSVLALSAIGIAVFLQSGPNDSGSRNSSDDDKRRVKPTEITPTAIKCVDCDGRGVQLEAPGNMTCANCRGSGKVQPTSACGECGSPPGEFSSRCSICGRTGGFVDCSRCGGTGKRQVGESKLITCPSCGGTGKK